MGVTRFLLGEISISIGSPVDCYRGHILGCRV